MSLRTRVLSVLVGTVLFLVAVPRASEAVHLIFAEAASDEGADVLVTKTGPSSAAANTDVSFNVIVVNVGPDDATNVTLTDAIPAGMTFVSGVQNNASPAFNCLPYPAVGSTGTITCTTPTLPAGASGDFTFVMHIASDAAPGTTITNTAVVTSAFDPNEENNSSSASVTTPGVDQADLNVTKTGPLNAGPNTDVTFTITVGNSGPNNGQSVNLSDPLPGTMTFVSMTQDSGPAFSCAPLPSVGSGGTVNCSISMLNAGQSASFTLIGHIPAGTSGGTLYSNNATVTSTTSDPNDENNVGTAAVQVSAVDLSVIKTGPATGTVGNNITWTINTANAGPDTAQSVVLSDSLPSGTTFISITQDTGPSANCTFPPAGANGTVTCTFAALGSGVVSQSQFTLTAFLTTNIPNGTVLNNTATIATGEFDTDTSNNTSTAATTITNTIVNQPPNAVDDSLSSVAEDSGTRTIPMASLMANDSAGPSDENNQTLTFSLIPVSGVGGTVSSDATNVYFTPAANFNGPASFQYQITDNGTTNGSPDPKSDIATVSFTITEVNDAPAAVNDTLTNVAEDSGVRTISFSTLTNNDSKGPNESSQTLIVKTVSNPVGGTVSIAVGNVLFTPTSDYFGPASFDCTVEDNGTTNGVADPKTSGTATVSFTITEVNDAPTAVNDTLSNVSENSGQRTIPFAVLTANDSKGPANESGQTLIVKTVGNAVGGTVSISGNNVLFTPTTNYNGPASFDYTVEDNGMTNGVADPRTSGPATASFHISDVNEAPTAVNDPLGNLTEDAPQRTIPFSALTANDSPGPANESGQTLIVKTVSNPVGITVSIVAGTVRFTPLPDYNGPASFQYTVEDNGTTNGVPDPKTSAPALVHFNITAVADTPSVTNATTNANTQTTSGLVISRNPADGAEVTHFKITNITGGLLFKNDGVTPINNGDFITFAEGNAGLKFTPGTTNGSFTVQASLSASDAGLSSLSGGTAVATIIVNPLGGVIRFSSATYSVAEGAGFRIITVERSGDTSQAVTVDYASSNHSTPPDFIPCTAAGAGQASSRCDFTTALGTLRFAAGETSKTFNVLISNDNYVEGPETLDLTLSNATNGAVFGVPQTAILTITDDLTEPATNPIDNAADFVRAQYHDVLNREPDAAGLAFWTDNIEKCNDPARRPAGQTVAQCIDKQRESTAIAFFKSPEFQITGGFVYHLYKGSLGRLPTFVEFQRDMGQVSEGIVVNSQISGAVVEANRNALATVFVQRSEFVAKYGGLNNTLYVQELFNTTGIIAKAAEKQTLVDGLTNGAETRAGALRKIVDGTVVISQAEVQFTTTYGQAFYNQEFTREFVFTEYAGYLRRNPDAAGFNFWVNKLNQFNGDPFLAQMVRAFITSPEYRARFGQP